MTSRCTRAVLRGRAGLCAALLVGIGLSGTVASGAPRQAPDTASAPSSGPKISFSTPIAAPGERTVVMMRLQDMGDAPITGIRADLEFPGELTFVEARPAFHQELSVKTTPVADPDPKANTRLAVVATAQKPIPAGDAIELLFEVSRQVYTDRDIPLTARGGSVQVTGEEALRTVPVASGKVTVTVASVVFACFFYMH